MQSVWRWYGATVSSLVAVRRLLEWLSGRFRWSQPSVSLDSQIGRRVWALGPEIGEHEFVAEAARWEADLIRAYRQLSDISVDGSAASNRAVRLREQISNALSEPNGRLAIAIRSWPPRTPGAHAILEDMRSEVLYLVGSSDEVVKTVCLRDEHLRKVEQLAQQFATSTPDAWSVWRGRGGLVDRLRRARTPAQVELVAEDSSWAEGQLSVHRDRLLKQEADLRNQLGKLATASDQNLEEAVTELAGRVRRAAALRQSAGAEIVDEACASHLARMTQRGRTLSLGGTPVGSRQRALIRWRQLRESNPNHRRP